MKRVNAICALLLALTFVCVGCGKRAVFDPEDAAPSAELTAEAAVTASETADDVRTTAGAAAESGDASEADGTTQTAETTAADTTKAGDTTKADMTKVGDVTKPGTTKTGDTTKPGTTKPGTTKPGTTKPGTTKPGTTKPGTTKPGTTKPGTTKPGTTKPGTTVPASNPSVTTTRGSGAPYALQNAKGNAVYAKRTLLNTTKKKASSLTAKDLARYGITGDKQAQVLRQPDNWTIYTIQVDFRNDEAVPITMYYLDVTGNGKGDVFVCGDFSAEIGLIPGGEESELFYVLARSSDSETDVLQKVSALSMRLQYAATPEDDEATPDFVYAKVI